MLLKGCYAQFSSQGLAVMATNFRRLPFIKKKKQIQITISTAKIFKKKNIKKKKKKKKRLSHSGLSSKVHLELQI